MATKLYRLVGYALGNKCLPLVVRAHATSASARMSDVEISWTLEDHFNTMVDIAGKASGPFRIIQNYSEKVLALFNAPQVKKLHKHALNKKWPKDGPTFMHSDGKNMLAVQVWSDGKWQTVDY